MPRREVPTVGDAPPTGAKPAVVLLSGGLDSATVLAVARAQSFDCHCLTFDYGQRHAAELKAAARVAQALGAASCRTAAVDLRAFGGSALTDDALDVPKDRDEAAMSADIPVTYVPARNTIFLSYALALAEVLGSTDLFIGVNAVDYSGYPDCRPEFIASFQAMANLATKAGVEAAAALQVHAPLISLTKVQIIELGLSYGVDYGLTHSCYDPVDGPSGPQTAACGRCDSCRLRVKAFGALGRRDPALGPATKAKRWGCGG